MESHSLKPFYHTDFKDIERIIEDKHYENKYLVKRLFSDKSKTLKATIKALLDEIRLRERLNVDLLSKIDEDICKCKTYLYYFDLIQPYAISYDLLSKKIKLQNQIFQLEQEKRKEYRECWHDLMFLKKYLMSALKDYWDISRKDKFLVSDFKI